MEKIQNPDMEPEGEQDFASFFEKVKAKMPWVKASERRDAEKKPVEIPKNKLSENWGLYDAPHERFFC